MIESRPSESLSADSEAASDLREADRLLVLILLMEPVKLEAAAPELAMLRLLLSAIGSHSRLVSKSGNGKADREKKSSSSSPKLFTLNISSSSPGTIESARSSAAPPTGSVRRRLSPR